MQLPHAPTASGVCAELLASWVASGGGSAKEVVEVERAMCRDARMLEWQDFGAGSDAHGVPRKQRLGTLARSASSDARKGRWLMAVTRHVERSFGRPARILELGTCLGSGADHLLTGGAAGTRYTGLEGSRVLAEITVSRLQRHVTRGLEIEVLPGPFDETLVPLLARAPSHDVVFLDGCHEGAALRAQWEAIRPGMPTGGVVIVDDIRWSRDMHDAWSVIAATEGWTALDLFRMGLLVAEAESAAQGVHRSSWSRRA